MAKRTDLMTSNEYLAHMALQSVKKSKYGNKWVKYDGHSFQSQAECDHYKKLMLQLQAGQIIGFERQKLFKLAINELLICTYRCDFFIKTLEGGYQVHDIKGFISDEYLIKKRLMKVIYNIDIIEPNLKEAATKRSRSRKFYNKK